jgi:anti-sigma-K factor RskA
MTQTNESPVGVDAPNRARTTAQANEPRHGTAARLAKATIERRLSGNERFDAEQIALEHAALVARIDRREGRRAENERQRIRASLRAKNPFWRLMEAVEQIVAQGGV